MKNSDLTNPRYIDGLRCKTKLWLCWYERLPQVKAHLAEFFTVLSLDSAPQVYATKGLYSKSGHCDCFDSCMISRPGGWLGASGLGFNMGNSGVAGYANAIKGVLI